MRLPTLLTAAVLLTVAALGYSQVPPPGPVGLPPGPPGPVTFPVPLDPNATTPPVFPSPAPISDPNRLTPSGPSVPLLTAPPPKPPEQRVDQLLAELERLKTQKAEIEKQEQAVKDALAKKLGEQNERLKRLGVGTKEESNDPLPAPKFVPSPDVAPAGGKEGVDPVAALPKGVRELKFDTTRCKRNKVGPSISVFTSEQQVEAELGEVEGKATWKQIDPKTEVLVVLGYTDTWRSPDCESFQVREVKADGSLTYRFKYGIGGPPGKQVFSFYTGFEWPARCKVYAVPKGAAVALD